MIAVNTRFGTFEVDDADYCLNETRDGVNILMRFVPGPGVDAAEIAMVQIANSIMDGSPTPINENPVIRHHSVPAGEPGAGFHVDQDPANRSPLYVVHGQPPGSDALDAGQPFEFFGSFGWRRRREDGRVSAKPASLRDKTHLVGAGPHCGQRFETTCLAVEGAQTGTYYGSVSWGWEIDARGKVHLLPISLVSMDVPSDVFVRAIEIWNASETSNGEPTIPLPMPTRAEPAVDLSRLQPEQLEALQALLRNLVANRHPPPDEPPFAGIQASHSSHTQS